MADREDQEPEPSDRTPDDEGREGTEVLAQLEAFKEQDPRYKEGRVWSLVYYIDEQHSESLSQVSPAAIARSRCRTASSNQKYASWVAEIASLSAS